MKRHHRIGGTRGVTRSLLLMLTHVNAPINGR